MEFLIVGIKSSRWTYVAPPPGTMPSLIAANVAFFASSILSFLSSSSSSVCAPTYTMVLHYVMNT